MLCMHRRRPVARTIPVIGPNRCPWVAQSCLRAALVADKQGRLHVVFADADSSRIVYRRSNDGGITWPVWSEIPGGANLNDEYSIYPRVAVDEHDRVYAVWIIEPWPGRYALFARSDDAGNTWTSPQVIDRYDSSQYESEGYGPEFIDVEAHADQVHLIWDGSPTVERTHIWSTDGGETWSKPAKLFPEITKVGRSGWNDMAFDSAGTLHAVALGEPLHASWSAGNWSRSMPIGQGRDSRGAEWMRLAVGLGNQLHVAWVGQGCGAVSSLVSVGPDPGAGRVTAPFADICFRRGPWGQRCFSDTSPTGLHRDAC
jgi:hypothetical protein